MSCGDLFQNVAFWRCIRAGVHLKRKKKKFLITTSKVSLKRDCPVEEQNLLIATSPEHGHHNRWGNSVWWTAGRTRKESLVRLAGIIFWSPFTSSSLSHSLSSLSLIGPFIRHLSPILPHFIDLSDDCVVSNSEILIKTSIFLSVKKSERAVLRNK